MVGHQHWSIETPPTDESRRTTYEYWDHFQNYTPSYTLLVLGLKQFNYNVEAYLLHLNIFNIEI